MTFITNQCLETSHEIFIKGKLLSLGKNHKFCNILSYLNLVPFSDFNFSSILAKNKTSHIPGTRQSRREQKFFQSLISKELSLFDMSSGFMEVLTPKACFLFELK
jgi:hypothetical protein